MTAEESPPRSRTPRVLAGAVLALVVIALAAGALLLGPSEGELAQIQSALKEQNAQVIDVRSPGEFAGGHLAGAINIPVGELGDRLAEVGAKDRPLVLY